MVIKKIFLLSISVILLCGMLHTFSFYKRVQQRCTPCPVRGKKTVSQTNQEPYSQQQVKFSFGEQLLLATKKNTPERLRFLLKNAVQRFKGDKEGFFKALNARDEDGFNIAHLSALLSDIENMASLFDALEEFYSSDPEGAFRYLIQRDKRGLTILGLAEYSANRRIMELILMRTMHLFGKNKELFFKFMYAGDYEENARPLGDAAYDSQFENVNMMVKVAAHVLGRDSELFKKLINAEEISGNNALSYAKQNQVKFFLMRYGAELPKNTNRLSRMLVEANNYGLELNDAINHDNAEKFHRILNKAKKFQDDDYALFTFFSTQNGAGWTPFINTAADDQIGFLKDLLNKTDELFDKEDKETKTLLLSNADFEGRTPLHLAIQRRNFEIARLIINTVVRYSVNKPFVYAVLSVANELNGFTPFINTIYASEDYDEEIYEFTKFFIERAEKLFGRDSRMFYLFMNTRDYNGWNPLAYATDHDITQLLKKHGAIDKMMPKYKGIGEFEKLEQEGEI